MTTRISGPLGQFLHKYRWVKRSLTGTITSRAQRNHSPTTRVVYEFADQALQAEQEAGKQKARHHVKFRLSMLLSVVIAAGFASFRATGVAQRLLLLVGAIAALLSVAVVATSVAEFMNAHHVEAIEREAANAAEQGQESIHLVERLDECTRALQAETSLLCLTEGGAWLKLMVATANLENVMEDEDNEENKSSSGGTGSEDETDNNNNDDDRRRNAANIRHGLSGHNLSDWFIGGTTLADSVDCLVVSYSGPADDAAAEARMEAMLRRHVGASVAPSLGAPFVELVRLRQAYRLHGSGLHAEDASLLSFGRFARHLVVFLKRSLAGEVKGLQRASVGAVISQYAQPFA